MSTSGGLGGWWCSGPPFIAAVSAAAVPAMSARRIGSGHGRHRVVLEGASFHQSAVPHRSPRPRAARLLLLGPTVLQCPGPVPPCCSALLRTGGGGLRRWPRRRAAAVACAGGLTGERGGGLCSGLVTKRVRSLMRRSRADTSERESATGASALSVADPFMA